MHVARRLRLLLLTLLSAVLLPLALPNDFVAWGMGALGVHVPESYSWGIPVLGIVALAPALYAVALTPTFGFASLLGVVFGAVSTALGNFWLMYFQGYSIWSYGGTVLGYVGYNALLFPFLRGFARLGGARFRPLLLAAAWAGYEYFKSVGFLGYPWGLIAYPVSGVLPLVQVADVTGAWGLCFLMAFANALAAEYAHQGPRLPFLRQAAFAAVLVALVLGYGAVRLATPIPADRTASLLLVQQDMDPWNEGAGRAESTQGNLDLTREGMRGLAHPPDLVVWSESSVSDVGVTLDRRYSPANNALVPGLRQLGVPVLFGGYVIVNRAKQQAMNGAILADANGAVVDTYGKMHPVPFAESIPFFEVDVVAKFFRNVVGIWLPWVSGARATRFSVPLRAGGTLTFGVPICFEDAFSDLCRRFVAAGADMLVNITNDSWSKLDSAEIQHFVVARLRAVENRRVLVRSTNAGLTAVVDPWGRVRARLPLFERGVLAVDLPVYREASPTVYTRLGDWFPVTLLLVLLAVLAGNRLREAAREKKRLPPAGSLS